MSNKEMGECWVCRWLKEFDGDLSGFSAELKIQRGNENPRFWPKFTRYEEILVPAYHPFPMCREHQIRCEKMDERSPSMRFFRFQRTSHEIQLRKTDEFMGATVLPPLHEKQCLVLFCSEEEMADNDFSFLILDEPYIWDSYDSKMVGKYSSLYPLLLPSLRLQTESQ